MLGNLLAGKGIVRAGSENKKGKGIAKAGSGNKKGKGIARAGSERKMTFLMLPHALTNFELERVYQNELRFNGVYSKRH